MNSPPRASLAARATLLLLSLSSLSAAGCRTRLWEVEGVPDLAQVDLSIPPDFAPPPDLTIPVVCREIYVVDQNGDFSGFDPLTAKFYLVRKLACPSNSSPQTMSVARDGRAWVFYSDHTMFYVDTKTGDCARSAFDGTQIENNSHYGSTFTADQPGGAAESVYLALPGDEVFGHLDPMTLKVDKFGAMGVVGSTGAELTGTSSAELWGFFPSNGASFIARINKVDGTLDERIDLPQINTQAAAFAFAFWGGGFWIFIDNVNGAADTQVFRVDRQTKAVDLVLKSTGRHIVGAGVSSCAPLGLDN